MVMNLSQPTLSKMADQELLEIFLPKRTVCELVAEYGSVQDALLNTCAEELTRVRGIGPVKARQLQYVCELAKRLYKVQANLPPAIRSPQDMFDRMADMQCLPVEQFRVVYLNTKNGIIAEETISQGTLNAAVVGPREVFRRAVRLMAAAVILTHNHPSGDPAPSNEDIALTKKLADAGKVMDIAVLDHVIVGKGQYVSFKEKGLL